LYKLIVIATSAAIAVATLAHAQEAEFSEIDVSIQLGDVNASNALKFWPTIEPDMEAVMRQRVSTIYNPNGLYVTVSVNEISFDGTRILSDDGEFNTLRGVAIIRDNASGPVVEVEEFGLRAQPWEVSVKDGMFVLADRADFYNAMLNNFADEMVTEINEE
jgi:hypothetical protein